jgi:hypothetical protein
MKLAGFSSDESLLYVRDETVELWNALNDTGGKSLSIDGPPGTGKSTEAWAWALWKAKHDNVTVTWFHLTKRQVVKVVVDGSTEQITTGFVARIEDIQASEGSLLICDGVTAQSNSDVSSACCNWRKSQCDSDRRFILVSSVSVAVALQENVEAGIVDFTVGSWTFKQYQDACEWNEFFVKVKDKLKCPGLETVDDKDQLLLAKYHFAGGCARWMFEFSYSDWLKDFNTHMAKVSSYTLLFRGGGGDETNVAVNHLRGVTMLTIDLIKVKKYFFISQCTVAELGTRCDDKRQFLINSYQLAKDTQNPAFEGWIFEFDVDYQLFQAYSDPLKKFCSKIRSPMASDTAVRDEQSVDKYLVFNSVEDLNVAITSLEENKVLWAKPKLWCQKAYDFLCIWKESESTPDGSRRNLRTNMVVANATLAQTHSLMLEEVHKLASKLGCGSVSAIRFDFIVPEGANFGVGSITGRLCEWTNLKGDNWPNRDNRESLGCCLALREVVRTS